MLDMLRIPWRLIVNFAVAAGIVGGVGYHFARLLARPELEERPPVHDWSGFVGCAVLFVAGLTCWGCFWARLVRRDYPHIGMGPLLASYLASHVGKYVPGKALVIVLRCGLASRLGVPVAVGAVTTIYETLTAMSCGAAVAVLVALATRPDLTGVIWKMLLALVLVLIPILPGIYNRIATRLARQFLPPNHPRLAAMPVSTLLEGFIFALAGWVCLGGSAGQLLGALLPAASWTSPTVLAQLVAWNALSTVGGFLAVPAPGGLGVREAILQSMLATMPVTPAIGDAPAALAAILLRLVWLVTEVLLAAVIFSGLWLRRVRT